jgi:hypothetical protein
VRRTPLLTGLVSVAFLVVGLVALLPDCASACGYSFSEGRKYLVYAEGERMKVNACGETTPLSKASADLEALGHGETLGGGGVLSDTSGGFPPLGIIGMMGLAVAALSLVVLIRLVRTS